VAASAADTKPLLAVMQLAPRVTSVTVGLSPKELAEEQVKRETQRACRNHPNYFVAYDNHAAPLSPRQKFNRALRRSSTRHLRCRGDYRWNSAKAGIATTNSVRVASLQQGFWSGLRHRRHQPLSTSVLGLSASSGSALLL